MFASVIVQSSNIKVQKEEFSVLYNKLLKKKFYFSQMVIWTIYFILLITVFMDLLSMILYIGKQTPT